MLKLTQRCKGCDFAPCLAEFVATFVFVFLGAGSIVMASYFGNFDGMAIAAVHGFTIFVMVAATANISGGHINPMVTYAEMTRDAFRGVRGKGPHYLGYIAAQLAGAAAGGGLLLGLSYAIDGGKTAAEAVNYGTPALADKLDPAVGILLEMIFSFILAFVVLRTAMEDKNSWAPFTIGMTVFVLALVGGPLTGAAMNPARWFGPALVSGSWDNAPVYIFAPMMGAVIAALVNELVSSKKQNPSPR